MLQWNSSARGALTLQFGLCFLISQYRRVEIEIDGQVRGKEDFDLTSEHGVAQTATQTDADAGDASLL